jgi:hypothetical protein
MQICLLLVLQDMLSEALLLRLILLVRRLRLMLILRSKLARIYVIAAAGLTGHDAGIVVQEKTRAKMQTGWAWGSKLR